jgi:hypothetical protein
MISKKNKEMQNELRMSMVDWVKVARCSLSGSEYDKFMYTLNQYIINNENRVVYRNCYRLDSKRLDLKSSILDISGKKSPPVLMNSDNGYLVLTHGVPMRDSFGVGLLWINDKPVSMKSKDFLKYLPEKAVYHIIACFPKARGYINEVKGYTLISDWPNLMHVMCYGVDEENNIHYGPTPDWYIKELVELQEEYLLKNKK